jgi:hypothetical protein
MQVYIAIQEFAAPQAGNRIHLGDTVGKITSRTTCMVDGAEFSNLAFFDWIGSVDSASYLVDAGVVPDPPFGGLVTGSTPIPSGVAAVTVAQAFGFLPTTVIVSVTKPDTEGVNIFATVNSDSITQTGFTVDLSGTTPEAGFVLNYFVKI